MTFPSTTHQRRILGIPFYTGAVDDLTNRIAEAGFVVVPSAPVLCGINADHAQRQALQGCDLALTDSSFFVLLWRLFTGERLPRISGLRFLRELIEGEAFRVPHSTFWIMPSLPQQVQAFTWLNANGTPVSPSDSYIAPDYPLGSLADLNLIAAIESHRPRFVVIAIGGGVQERLGLYLRTNLSFRPTILCIGAAIAFLSGAQVRIPNWMDRLGLGWLSRIVSNPVRFLPRYGRSVALIPIVWRESRRLKRASRADRPAK